MKRSHIRFVIVMTAVLLAAAVAAVVVGYGGELVGTAVLDAPESPLESPTPEPPTDTPEPVGETDTPIPPTATPEEAATITETPTPTAISVYRVRIEVAWYDAAGNRMAGPPPDLPAGFEITAQSSLGVAVCDYAAGASRLECRYTNQGVVGSSGGEGLAVPAGGAYTVSQSGLPAGWRSYTGVGMFPGSGSADAFTHVIDNRAPGAPPPSPTPALPTLSNPPPEATAVSEMAMPVIVEPMSTPTSMPVSEPSAPVLTSMPEPPISTPEISPGEMLSNTPSPPSAVSAVGKEMGAEDTIMPEASTPSSPSKGWRTSSYLVGGGIIVLVLAYAAVILLQRRLRRHRP